MKKDTWNKEKVKDNKHKKQQLRNVRDKEDEKEVEYYVNGLDGMNERDWGDYE